ncbi:MAG: LLM class flavin-dependent oxidoreductase [Gammaproteobacteria bacterium]|nr:LLM class flavin-dependent oxidoreductase [Gammaproteobacteria bacterium]
MMQILWFTERAYHTEDQRLNDRLEDLVIANQSFFGTPNTMFDRKIGADLLNMYLDEKIYADELGGFDGVMLNEHHANPWCLGAVMDVEAAILAKVTKKGRIVLLGNPIPTTANPLRLAEELAMIDLISGGRLVSGWVRGAGCESLATGANPAFNRELYEEGHDLILKAWTDPGPFRWEGKHYHYRYVNPWVKPLQTPHPPIWIPGLVSPDTVRWAARKRYPYIALATYLEPTAELWNIYTETAAEEGYQAGPENFGYLQPVFVGDSQQRAEELGKRFLFGGNFAHFARPEWMFPSGYNTKEATRRLARQFTSPNTPGRTMASEWTDTQDVQEIKRRIYGRYDKAREDLQMIAGTPEHVIPRLKHVMNVLRPGVLSFWIDGPVPREERLKCLRLLAHEVVPALREHAKTLGIVDPFERKPGSVPLNASGKPESVSRLNAVAAY